MRVEVLGQEEEEWVHCQGAKVLPEEDRGVADLRTTGIGVRSVGHMYIFVAGGRQQRARLTAQGGTRLNGLVGQPKPVPGAVRVPTRGLHEAGCYLGAQIFEHNGRAICQAVVAELLAVIERHRARLPWLGGQGEALPCGVVLALKPVKLLLQFRDGRLRQGMVSRSSWTCLLARRAGSVSSSDVDLAPGCNLRLD